MIRQLVYVSTADAIAQADVDSIVTASERHNAAVGITGFLLFNGRNFLQVIEGDHAAIGALLEKLRADARHTGLVTIEDREVAARAFPDWSMRRLSLLDGAEGRREALDRQLPDTIDTDIRRIVLNFAALN